VFLPAVSAPWRYQRIVLRQAVATTEQEPKIAARSDAEQSSSEDVHNNADENESWGKDITSSSIDTAAKGVLTPRQVDVAGLVTSVFRAQAMGMLVSVREAEKKLEADISTVMVTVLFMVAVIIFEYGVQSLLDHFLGDSVTGSVSCILGGLGMVFSVKLSGFKWSNVWTLDRQDRRTRDL
jgi:hypothetical protein